MAGPRFGGPSFYPGSNIESGTITGGRSVVVSDEAGNMIELLGWESPPVRERPPEHLKFSSTGLVEVCLIWIAWRKTWQEKASVLEPHPGSSAMSWIIPGYPRQK